MANPLPSIDELFDRFYVDSTSPSGLRYAKDLAGTRIKAHDVAGALTQGYWRIIVAGKGYQVHRIVHVMRSGVDDPNLTVDHKDRNSSNNHPFNLRWATQSEQCLNRRNFGQCAKGVYVEAGRSPSKPYKAQIRIDGKPCFLGYHRTEAQAVEVYEKACHMRKKGCEAASIQAMAGVRVKASS
jgi:hypothetical protein